MILLNAMKESPSMMVVTLEGYSIRNPPLTRWVCPKT